MTGQLYVPVPLVEEFRSDQDNPSRAHFGPPCSRALAGPFSQLFGLLSFVANHFNHPYLIFVCNVLEIFFFVHILVIWYMRVGHGATSTAI